MQLRFSFDSLPLAQDESFDSRPLAQDESSDDTPPTVFVRHRRARRYVLRVLADGTLRVTLPRWGSKREAQAIVEAAGQWIAEQRARQRRFSQVRTGATVLGLLVERWYRRKAARELPSMLMALAGVHGIPVTRVSIRDQRSRWGACSANGTITLNWRLIRVPPFVREYVLLHELMHRRELNHSRRFWRLVAASCPRHAEARQWLKQEGKLLWSDHASVG